MKNIFKKVILIIPLIVLLFPAGGICTVEYSKQTGKDCGNCHIEATGGGKLTKEGDAFKDELRLKGLYRPLTKTQHVVRFIIGYLHSLTAIAWFGAILYVHILLKPAYAARGLPKGELMLGWGSIIIMAITGTLLSIARVPGWWALFHTRFGILLTIKIVLFLIMVSTAVIVTFIIGPKLKKKKEQAIIEHKQDLTPDELSQFDGKDGRPAFIAYKGNIYDVSGSKLWRGGIHLKKHLSGSDLTDVLKTAPHGEEKILVMSVVGKLVSKVKEERTRKPKLFYFLAYMNLIIVFLIVFVISLWRWW